MSSKNVSDKDNKDSTKESSTQYDQPVQLKHPLIIPNSDTDSLITNFGSIESIQSATDNSFAVPGSGEILPDPASVSADRTRKIRFRDEGPDEELDPGKTSVVQGLVDIAYFDTLMKAKHPWEDPNYYAGFTDLFTADEIWISDISFLPCRIHSTYEIESTEGKPLFYLEKDQDTWMTWAKSLCLRCFSKVRNGFTISIFSPQQAILAKFIRKSHCCANQMDIVETFYGKEESYIGRIEKTRHGFVIRDKYHEDIYRIVKSLPPREESSCLFEQKKEMKIFRTDSKEVVGRLVYFKKGFFMGCISSCTRTSNFGILCNPDVGTNAKILLIGALFLQLHSKDKFTDLPLGNDSVQFDNQVQPTVPVDGSDTSLELDLLLSPFTYSAEKL